MIFGVAPEKRSYTHEKGHGVEQDYEKAEEYYRIAADMGVQEAVDALERLMEKGSVEE